VAFHFIPAIGWDLRCSPHGVLFNAILKLPCGQGSCFMQKLNTWGSLRPSSGYAILI
jgi:hypothetical protein